MSHYAPDNPPPSNGFGYAIIALLAAVFVSIAVLQAMHESPDTLINFATWVLPVIVLQLYNAKTASDASNRLRRVEDQTNGKLTAQLNAQTDALKEHITTATSNTGNIPKITEEGK